MGALRDVKDNIKILFITSVTPLKHPFVEQQIQLVKKNGCDVRVITRVHSMSEFKHPEIIYDGFLSQEIPFYKILLTIVKAYICGAIDGRFKEFIEKEAEWNRLGLCIGAKRAYHWMRIAKLVKKWQPDLIHVHFAWHLPFAIPFANYFSIPIVCTAHGSDIYFENNWCDYLIDQNVKNIIAVSESIYVYMLHHCPSLAEKIVLIYNPINPSFLKPIVPPPEALSILNVAAFSDVKNQAWLVRAMVELKKRGICFKCKFIGEGENYDKIRNQVNDFDLNDRVDFLGFLPHREVLDAMDAASVFVLTSKSEGLPTVILEALARSCVVVATDLPGIRDATNNGAYGLLVPIDDDIALADAIEKAAKFNVSVVEDAHKWVSDSFNWESHWSKLESVYLNALNN